MGMGMAVHTDTWEKMSFTLAIPFPPLPHSLPPPRGPVPPIIQVPFLSYGHQVSLWSCEFWAWEARVV